MDAAQRRAGYLSRPPFVAKIWCFVAENVRAIVLFA
jgi:hypothetical protein